MASRSGRHLNMAPRSERHEFVHDGVRLAYEIHGEGPRSLLYLHSLLTDANFNRGLATALAVAGNRVVLLDLPGHGRSESPRRATAHRMDTYAGHVLGLLDHLGVDRAVVGGVSLGANVALLTATRVPERIQGLLIEMPVLEWAAPAAAMVFVPLLVGVHYGATLVRLVGSAARRLPTTGNWAIDGVVASVRHDPDEIAAVLHGVLMGPAAPTVEERRALTMPALVIGHKADVVHPFNDAANLVRQLPSARLLEARSILELRLVPRRLTTEIAAFLDEAWSTSAVDELSRARPAG